MDKGRTITLRCAAAGQRRARRTTLPRIHVQPLSSSAASQASRPAKRLKVQQSSPGFARRLQRQPPERRQTAPAPPPPPQQQQQALTPARTVQNAIQQNSANLVAPVHIPDDRFSVLPADHPATSILANSSIVVHRQLEMMNVLLGYEQANKYVINDAHGATIGYLAEEDHGLGKAMARQFLHTHRSFTTHVFDRAGAEVLRFHRPFSWISSRIRVYDTLSRRDLAAPPTDHGAEATASPLPLDEMRVIGEAQQQWAPLRRKYNLFLHRDLDQLEQHSKDAPQLASGDLPLSASTALEPADAARASLGFAQFASVNEPLLSWDFSLRAEDGSLLGSVNRSFAGFGRELFTDTGVYALRMDSAGQSGDGDSAASALENAAAHGMTLDQRAVMLATAVSIDFDYFSRDRGGVMGGGAGFFPIWFPMGGGGAGAGEAGEAGAASEASQGAAPPPYDPQSPTGGQGTEASPWGEEVPWGAQQQPGMGPQDEFDPWGGRGGTGSGGFDQGSSGAGGGGGGDGGGGSFFDFFDE